MLLQGLDDLDAGDVLIRGAIAEIEEEVEPLLDQSFDLADRSLLPLEGRDRPLGLGEKGTWIAWPIVLWERIGIEILRRQQADSHGLKVRLDHHSSTLSNQP